MNKEEIKKWIDRWSKLKPSPRRNMTIEIWSKALGTCNMENETLKEAAEKWVFETNGHKWSNNDDTAGDNYGSFVEGAKWQAERIPSIIEEYLETAFISKEQGYMNPQKWFEQFKKK